MPSHRRLTHLDIARGIAIILVVWGHADRRMEKVFFSEYLATLGDIIYAFHVALLFIISGALHRKMFDQMDGGAILKRVSESVLMPFITLSSFFMTLILVTPEHLLAGPSFSQMIKGIFYYQSSADHAPSGVLWFFFVLFEASVLTMVLKKYVGLNLKHIFLVAILIKLSSTLVYNEHIFAIDKFTRNYVFYAFGLWCVESITKAHSIKFEIGSLLGSILLFIPFFVFMDTFKPLFQLATGIFGGIAVISFSSIAAKRHFPFSGAIKYCGVNSIFIYVFHMPFFTIIKPAIYSLKLSASMTGVLLWVLLGVLMPLVLGSVMRLLPVCSYLFFGRRVVLNRI